MKYKLDGEDFNIDAFQVIDDIQYPVGWFHSKENRDAMGVVEVPDDAPGEEQPPVVPVPQSVTRRQARQALLLRGLLDQIEPAIEALPDELQRGLALIEWQDSLNFERSRPLVVQIGAAIGLDTAGLDELFIFAATL